MNINQFKQILFQKASEEGFSDYEIYYSIGKSLKVNVFKGEVEKFENATSGGVSFRGIYNGKMGYAYSEKLDLNAIENLLKHSKENSEIVNEDEIEEIFSGSQKYSQVQTFYEDLENINLDFLIENCILMEKEALNYDEKIFSCNNCSLGKSYSKTYISNSKGLELTKETNYIFAYVGVLAKDVEEPKSGFEIFVGFDLKNLDVQKIAKKACEKALEALGATSVKTAQYNVIFQNEAFTDLFSCFISNFFAENVQRGFSLLKGKLNKKVACNKISILEKPLMEKGYSSTPFDSEGVACYDKTVVENGILKTYLYNLKSAKKDKTKSTGNGFKSGYKGSIVTSVTNFYIENGEKTLEDMFEKIGNGIFIKGLSGLHAGVNSISGDFSLLAEGHLVENGRLKRPINQITIAGNFYKLMEDIQEIGNDLEIFQSGIGSPSVFAGKLNVAGENI